MSELEDKLCILCSERFDRIKELDAVVKAYELLLIEMDEDMLLRGYYIRKIEAIKNRTDWYYLELMEATK